MKIPPWAFGLVILVGVGCEMHPPREKGYGKDEAEKTKKEEPADNGKAPNFFPKGGH